MPDSFIEAVAEQADADVDRILSTSDVMKGVQHRELMRRALALIGAWRIGRRAGDAEFLQRAAACTHALSALQAQTGMFIGGDNVDSPPDSAFTINDLCDAHALLRQRSDCELACALAEQLAGIAAGASEGLLRGGVHTPNHRWEIASALTRLHREWPDPRYVARAEEWLAEGPDIDADGMWSERSAIYASAVSNPAFVIMAEVLERPELLEPVRRNLDATLGLVLPDDTIETVHSRRQDQGERFNLGPYAPLLWYFAALDDRCDFGRMARRALEAGVPDAGVERARFLLHSPLIGPLPPETSEEQREASSATGAPRIYTNSRLVLNPATGGTVVVFGGSDVPALGRIRSGQANSPTFLRWVTDGPVLEAARLSREFFGLGPFRAQEMDVTTDAGGGTVVRLHERLRAVYHHPLPPSERRPGGDYLLEDEGRYTAAMSFPARTSDQCMLDTRIEILIADDVRVAVDMQGANIPWSLQLTFRSGGALSPVDEEGRLAEFRSDRTGTMTLATGTGRYRTGGECIEFGPAPDATPCSPGFYDPGQDYTYLHGTDQLAGDHVYLTGRAPGTFSFRLGLLSS